MAKLLDKLYNRVIEGELLEITEEEKSKLGLGGGTKLYKHVITISRSGASSLVLSFITNSSNKMKLEDGNIDDNIGEVIRGFDITTGGSEFYKCSKLSKPFPTASFLTCLREVSKTISDESVLGSESLSITPTEIVDEVTSL